MVGGGGGGGWYSQQLLCLNPTTVMVVLLLGLWLLLGCDNPNTIYVDDAVEKAMCMYNNLFHSMDIMLSYLNEQTDL